MKMKMSFYSQNKVVSSTMSDVYFVNGHWTVKQQLPQCKNHPVKRLTAKHHNSNALNEDPAPLLPIGDLFDQFFHTTTIHGCNHLGGAGQYCRKIFWMVVFVVGIAMAIYQSSSLINEYRRYAVTERSDRKNRWELPFPSVTVCINSPIRWTLEHNQTFGQSVVARTINKSRDIPEGPNTDLANDFSERERILLEELISLNEWERLALGFQKDEFVIFCTFGSDDCMNQLYQFNDLYYGNCVTFNPGFPFSKEIYANKIKTLNMVFRSDFEERYPYLRRDTGLVALVHSPGTAPTLNRRSILQLYPRRWIKYGVAQIVYGRLPPPFSSQCVDGDDIGVRKKLFHHQENRPYLYTIDACLDSCLQRLAMKFCNCVITDIPFPSNHQKSLCPYEGCDFIHDVKQYSHCPCRQACREISYDTIMDTDDRWLEQDVWLEWVNHSLKENQRRSINM